MNGTGDGYWFKMYKRNKEIVDFVVHLLYNIWNYTIIMKG